MFRNSKKRNTGRHSSAGGSTSGSGNGYHSGNDYAGSGNRYGSGSDYGSSYTGSGSGYSSGSDYSGSYNGAGSGYGSGSNYGSSYTGSGSSYGSGSDYGNSYNGSGSNYGSGSIYGSSNTGPGSSYGSGSEYGGSYTGTGSSGSSNYGENRGWDYYTSQGSTSENGYGDSDRLYTGHGLDTTPGSGGSSEYRHRTNAASPRKPKRDWGWIKYLLIGLGLLLLLFLLLALLVPAIRERKSEKAAAVDVTEDLLADGQAVLSVYEEKILQVYPYLPEEYEDTSLGEIVVTNLEEPSLIYTGTFYGNLYYYVLEEGTYLVEVEWDNGMTASSYVRIGEQGLYYLEFSHF